MGTHGAEPDGRRRRRAGAASSSARDRTPVRRGRTPRSRRCARRANVARGATVYVTLEPCKHHGKTPPCVDALIAAGVSTRRRRVRDPRSVARGRRSSACAPPASTSTWASRRPRRASSTRPSSTRSTGRPPLGHAQARALARRRDRRSRARRPRLAHRRSGAPRRARLRARRDAIAVGIGTALADDPDAHRARRTRRRGSHPCGWCSTARRACRWARGSPAAARDVAGRRGRRTAGRCARRRARGARSALHPSRHRRRRRSTPSAARGSVRCSWRGARRWPGRSSRPNWWIGWLSFRRRSCSVPARSARSAPPRRSGRLERASLAHGRVARASRTTTMTVYAPPR